MHGNVWEWSQDWYGDYPHGAIKDPQGSLQGKDRVLRGGSWSDFARNCRTGTRYWDAPVRHANCGFRLLLPL